MEQTLLARPRFDPPPLPSEDIQQLSAILGMVDELAGEHGTRPPLDDLAAIDAAYAVAPPLIRARYARLAARTASLSAAGIAAFIATGGNDASRRSAAAYLSGEMRHAIGTMAAVFA